MYKFPMKSVINAVLGRYFSMILTVSSFIMLGKYFGTADLGLFSASFGIASSFCYWIGLGASEAILRSSTNKDVNKEWWASNAFFAHISGVSISVIVCVIVTILFINEIVGNLVLYITIWTVAWGLSISLSHILILFKKEQYGNFLFYGFPASISFLTILFSCIYQVEIESVIMVVAVLYIVISVLLSFFVMIFLWRIGISLEHVSTLKLLCDGILYSTSRVIQSVILWCPVWLATALYSLDAAAMISIVYRLGLGVNAFMSAIRLMLRRVTLLTFDSNKAHRNLLFNRISYIGTISSLICIFTLIPVYIFGDWIFITFFNINNLLAKYLLAVVIISLAVECQFSLQEDLMKNVLNLNNIVLVQSGMLLLFILTIICLSNLLDLYAFVWAFFFQILAYQTYISFRCLKKYGLCVKPTLKLRNI
jgi:O-antigen/teichoic acid export membrane protein